MSRRGRSGPAISLFSFQDIITSVTAIVTVIALLLALDLVQRKQSSANDSSSSLAQDLVARLERAEAELMTQRTITDTTDKLVREVANTSPAELRTEIAERESVIAELTRECTRLQEQQHSWQTKEKAALAEQFDVQPLKEQQATAEQQATKLENQRKDEQSENRTVFALPRGVQIDGWLVAIDADQISVAPLGRVAQPIEFVASGLPLFGSSTAQAFGQWIDKQQHRSAYFLLLVRPGAAKQFEEVQKFCSSNSISYGFDLIGADQVVLHPERGAAP